MKSLHPQPSRRSQFFSINTFLFLVVFLPLGCTAAQVNNTSRRCEHTASVVTQPGSWLTRLQVEANLADAYFNQKDMESYLTWLQYLANAPYAHPRDMMRVGDYYFEKHSTDAAEAWYRRAVKKSNGELAIRLDLLRMLLPKQDKTEAIRELNEIVRHPDFLVTTQAAWLSLLLSQVYHQESQQSSAALAAATAIFQAPEVYNNWHAWDALKSEADKLTGDEWITGPPSFTAFRNLLREGAPHTWPLTAIEKNIIPYEEYIEQLRRSGNTNLALFFSERTATFIRFFAIDEARRGRREHSLALHSIAERLTPLSMHSLSTQVTTLRDIADMHAHLGHFRHALASVERLLLLCNGRHWTEEEVCPEQGRAPDLIERNPMSGQSGEERNYDFLGHIIDEARAAVSFDQNSGRLRYQDGHDFPPEEPEIFPKHMHETNPAASRHEGALKTEKRDSSKLPYSSTSQEEDRVAFLEKTFLSPLRKKADHRFNDRLAAEISAGRFELPIKVLLSRLSLFRCRGATPSELSTWLKQVGLGKSLKELSDAIAAAPQESIPQSTRDAYDVVERVILLCKHVNEHKHLNSQLAAPARSAESNSP